MNYVSAPRLADFLKRRWGQMSLSDILIGRRLVTEHDVMAAREIQRRSGAPAKRIGEVLVDMGIIEERHVVEALSEKFGMKMLDPDITEIDGELVRKVSLKYLRRQIALPIRVVERTVVAAGCRSDQSLHSSKRSPACSTAVCNSGSPPAP